MQKSMIRHIWRMQHKPVLDAKGDWCFFVNAKCCTKAIAAGAVARSQVVWHRGRHNWMAVWKSVFEPKLADDEVFLFTFVRNPWDRVVSAFSFCQQHSRSYRIAKKWTFDEWVRRRLAIQGPDINMHFARQSDQIMYKGQLLPGMFVGRVEQFEQDWAHVAQRLSLPQQLPTKNASKHGHYTDYYTPLTKNIVGVLYRKEIEALGYQYGA